METHGRRFVDLTGQKFGKLTVMRFHGKNHRGASIWWCKCECGKEITAYAANLKKPNHTTSCGCVQAEITRERSTIHGFAPRKNRTSEYMAWAAAKQRTSNPNNHRHQWYFDEGKRMCSGFSESFEHFIGIIGQRPTEEHSIDRINNDGHYSCGVCAECLKSGWPMNVRWATKIQQMNNMRTSLQFDGKNVSQIAEEMKMPIPDVRTMLGLKNHSQ